MMMPQIVVQRCRPGLLEQRLEHHVLATARRELLAIFRAERCAFGLVVLAFDPAALVAVTLVKSGSRCFRHLILLRQLSEWPNRPRKPDQDIKTMCVDPCTVFHNFHRENVGQGDRARRTFYFAPLAGRSRAARSLWTPRSK